MSLPELTLPWPARALHPNARVHWRTKAAETKKARSAAFLLAREAGWMPGMVPAEGKLDLIVDFVPPDRRLRDDDGMPSAFKAWRDGLADALGIDDHRFRATTDLLDDPVKGGAVRVRVQIRTLDQVSAKSDGGRVL